MILTRPGAVFVPYELKGQQWVRVFDLPRFVEPREVIIFLQEHRFLKHRRLDWIEHWDRESIREYMLGVGTQQTAH